jgi:hypothetical protein
MPSGRLTAEVVAMAKKKKPNPAAVKLGSLGGKARAKNLSKRDLSKIGRKAAAARWKKAGKNAEHLP